MKYNVFFFLFTVAAAAQPVINAGGITNIASPFSGIAPGSIFVINGTGLGAPNPNPMNLFQNTTYPLPASSGLNGTTIQFVPMGGQGPVVANQGTIYAIMLYQSDTLLAAILPSSTQVANYNVTVNYNGQASTTSPQLHVVSRAVGLFTYAQFGGNAGIGYGPGIELQENSAGNFVVDNFSTSATPGGSILIFATGLGAVNGDESLGPAQSGILNLSAGEFQIYIGNQPATFAVGQDYIGRFISGSTSYAGVDVIEVQVPHNVQGCNVPVMVVMDGVSSNSVTMSIDPSGSYCSEPVFGYSQADLQRIHDDQMAHIGTVGVAEGTVSGIAQDGSLAMTRVDTVTTSFVNLSPIEYYGGGGIPSEGGCTVSPVGPTLVQLPQAFKGAPLDAGSVLNLNTPDGYQSIMQNVGQLTYGTVSNTNNPLIDPGGFEFDNGGGGADVGAFQGIFNVPAGPQIAGLNAGGTLSTKADQIINWTGGDPNSETMITGLSANLNTGYAVAIECVAPPSAQQFTIPQYVLSWMPTGDSTLGLLTVQSMGQARFQAPGLEVGYFTYLIGPGIQVQYSSGPPVKEFRTEPQDAGRKTNLQVPVSGSMPKGLDPVIAAFASHRF